jgi:hypothetical protein
MNKLRLSAQVLVRLQQGAAMLEFGLILPMLVILLFGSAEVGRVLYQQNELTKAAIAGTRFIARSPDAVATGCGQGAAWGAATATASALIAFSQDTGEVRLVGLDEPGAIVFSLRSEMLDGQSVCIIQTDARVTFAGLFGDTIIPLMNTGMVELNAIEEERYIGD